MMRDRRRTLLACGLCAFAIVSSAWMSRADGRHKKDGGKQTVIAPVAAVQAVPAPAQEAPKEPIPPTGSLWGKSSRSLFEDVKASKVGDTITIIVQETASASSAASTKSSRDDSAKFGGGTGFLRNLVREFGASASNSINGQGTTTRTGSLVTRLSATIKEILPNGNLMVEGVRTVGVNSEKQKVIISGVVRPQDINPDNTVSSVALANATIQYDGKGTVGDRQKKGLLSSIFGWLF